MKDLIIVNNQQPAVGRQCGTCTACCKVVGVEELNKPQNKWCTHCHIGHGCMIYDTRPEGCKRFECLWLRGQTPEDLLPKDCHVVLDATMDGRRVVAHVDSYYPDAYKTGRVGRYLHSIARAGLDVVVLIGDERRMLTINQSTKDLVSEFCPKEMP
jgi:hypothetical protein